MTKRYLKTPEEVSSALKEGKVVLDRTGNTYKSINSFVVVRYVGGGWGIDPFIGSHEGLYIDEPEPLKLEVGKFYKTRDGRKAWIIAYQQGKHYPYIVAVLGLADVCAVLGNGCYFDDKNCGKDLVAPWEE